MTAVPRIPPLQGASLHRLVRIAALYVATGVQLGDQYGFNTKMVE
jgi:hypothetical protein